MKQKCKDMNNQENKVEVVTKISVPDTLLSIPVGETKMIPTRVIKTGSLKAAATRLMQKRKAHFFVTVAGLIDETRVTRLK
jgi:hypothetical protein